MSEAKDPIQHKNNKLTQTFKKAKVGSLKDTKENINFNLTFAQILTHLTGLNKTAEKNSENALIEAKICLSI